MSEIATVPAAAPGGGVPDASRTFAALEEAVAGVVHTEPLNTRLAVACLAARGHLLVEDHPGLGKTTLAKALAAAVGLGFRRLQCTADLLPADVTGATMLPPDGGPLAFRPGPVFTNVLMADELNRASPRAQSALLEAMEERQVTVDGHTYSLPNPFFVLATQNPYDSSGTSPLPHGQRDRFLVRISLGYPTRPQMDALLTGADPADRVRSLPPAVSGDAFEMLMAAVEQVQVVPAVRAYVLDLIDATHRHPSVAVGVSPRGARSLVSASSALALGAGRAYLTPTDVQQAAPSVLGHRLLLHPAAEITGNAGERLVEELVGSLPVPVHPDSGQA